MSGRIKGYIASLSIIGGFALPALGLAHPTLFAHSHASSDIKWELDQVKDGDSAHNHYSNLWYGLGQLDDEEPFDVHGCWDNRSFRYLDPQPYLQPLDFAHCYVDEDNLMLGHVPTYKFAGSGWPSGAKSRISDAFDEWESVGSMAAKVGLRFAKITSGVADINIYWVSTLPGLPPPNATGKWEPTNRSLYFKNIPNWNYSKYPSGIPSSDYHFYSVALHEVGHAIGLDHTGSTDSIMYIDPTSDIGAPANQGGRHFSSIDDSDKVAVRNVYSIPKPAPPACTLRAEFGYCIGNTTTWSITALLPEYEVLNADYDIQLGGAGGWIDIFEGILTCPSVNLDIAAIARAILLTEYGVSECSIPIPLYGCGGGGQPF